MTPTRRLTIFTHQTDSRPHSRLTRAMLGAMLSAMLLAGCAAVEKQDSEPDPMGSKGQRDVPDPFEIVELANLRLAADPGPEITETAPPDLWKRLIDRFAFAECPENSRSQQWARWYGERDEYMERVLNRARPWLHDIAEELEQRDLPGELALLPIVESAYDPFAYSHGRAAGTWQFLSSTAREYGIEINDFYDGRRDVWAATRAALDYLNVLHQRFGDWNLALAAYNGGQGRVQRAINRNRARNRSTEWHELSLPRETLAYVPKLNGLGCLFAEPEQYGFSIPVWEDRPRVERVVLAGPVDVVVLAAAADLDMAELVALNPGLNRHLTPPSGPHHLLVPIDRADRVRKALPHIKADDMLVWDEITVRRGDTLSHIATRNNTSVAELKRANALNGDMLKVGQKLRLAAGGTTPEDSPHAQRYRELAQLQQRLLPTRRFQHQVRPGENLWLIARQYRVSVSDLQRWNNLGSNNLIRPGQRLLVHMDQPGGQQASPTVEYTVRRGDSLWTIARRHQVSVRDLMRWNNLSDRAILRPGQKLTVQRGGRA